LRIQSEFLIRMPNTPRWGASGTSCYDVLTTDAGEHASLNAIHDAVPNFCPKSYAHGPLRNRPGTFFLATDFLELGSTAPGGSGLSLAAKLAKLHTTPAPVPAGYDRPMFGFPVPTCCGATEQDNERRASWADFYADNRLRAVLAAGVRRHGTDAGLAVAVEATVDRVVPRLLGGGEGGGGGLQGAVDAAVPAPVVVPVVVHGDLWSGNHGRARMAGRGGAEEVVYDPSACYGHSEYDLGIMRMFGGFGAAFWREYAELVPQAEPREEWEDRIALYEL